jgi:hypothetical protein
MVAVSPVVVHTTVRTTVHTTGLATTILAALGVLLALLSIAWQAWSFMRSGSRVSVVVHSGLWNATGAMTVPGSPTEAMLQQMRAQGFREPALAIEVRNAGRGPTSVVKLAIHFGKGVTWTDFKFDPPLSFRLEGESEQTWLVDAPSVVSAARALALTAPDAPWTTGRARAWIGGREKPIESKNSAKVL